MLQTLEVISSYGPVRVELALWQGEKGVVVKRLLSYSSAFRERLKREAVVLKIVSPSHRPPVS
ncbi:MAG: hypothetical protein R2880_07770 [Deinococcales bacterium]